MRIFKYLVFKMIHSPDEIFHKQQETNAAQIERLPVCPPVPSSPRSRSPARECAQQLPESHTCVCWRWFMGVPVAHTALTYKRPFYRKEGLFSKVLLQTASGTVGQRSCRHLIFTLKFLSREHKNGSQCRGVLKKWPPLHINSFTATSEHAFLPTVMFANHFAFFPTISFYGCIIFERWYPPSSFHLCGLDP